MRLFAAGCIFLSNLIPLIVLAEPSNTCPKDQPPTVCTVNGKTTVECGKCPQLVETVTPGSGGTSGSSGQGEATTNKETTGDKKKCDLVNMNGPGGGILTCSKVGWQGEKWVGENNCEVTAQKCDDLRDKAVEYMKYKQSVAGEAGLEGSPSGAGVDGTEGQLDKAYESVMGQPYTGDNGDPLPDEWVPVVEQALNDLQQDIENPDSWLNESFREAGKSTPDISISPDDLRTLDASRGISGPDWLYRAIANDMNGPIAQFNPNTPYYTTGGQSTFGQEFPNAYGSSQGVSTAGRSWSDQLTSALDPGGSIAERYASVLSQARAESRALSPFSAGFSSAHLPDSLTPPGSRGISPFDFQGTRSFVGDSPTKLLSQIGNFVSDPEATVPTTINEDPPAAVPSQPLNVSKEILDEVGEEPSKLPPLESDVKKLYESLESGQATADARANFLNEVLSNRDVGWSEKQLAIARDVATEEIASASAALDNRTWYERWADNFVNYSDEQWELVRAEGRLALLNDIERSSLGNDAVGLSSDGSMQKVPTGLMETEGFGQGTQDERRAPFIDNVGDPTKNPNLGGTAQGLVNSPSGPGVGRSIASHQNEVLAAAQRLSSEREALNETLQSSNIELIRENVTNNGAIVERVVPHYPAVEAAAKAVAEADANVRAAAEAAGLVETRVNSVGPEGGITTRSTFVDPEMTKLIERNDINQSYIDSLRDQYVHSGRATEEGGVLRFNDSQALRTYKEAVDSQTKTLTELDAYLDNRLGDTALDQYRETVQARLDAGNAYATAVEQTNTSLQQLQRQTLAYQAAASDFLQATRALDTRVAELRSDPVIAETLDKFYAARQDALLNGRSTDLIDAQINQLERGNYSPGLQSYIDARRYQLTEGSSLEGFRNRTLELSQQGFSLLGESIRGTALDGSSLGFVDRIAKFYDGALQLGTGAIGQGTLALTGQGNLDAAFIGLVNKGSDGYYQGRALDIGSTLVLGSFMRPLTLDPGGIGPIRAAGTVMSDLVLDTVSTDYGAMGRTLFRTGTEVPIFTSLDAVAANTVEPGARLVARDFGAGPYTHVADTPLGPVYSRDPLPTVAPTMSTAERAAINAFNNSGDRSILTTAGLDTTSYGILETNASNQPAIVRRSAIINQNGQVVAASVPASAASKLGFETTGAYEFVAPVQNRSVFSVARDWVSSWFTRTTDSSSAGEPSVSYAARVAETRLLEAPQVVRTDGPIPESIAVPTNTTVRSADEAGTAQSVIVAEGAVGAVPLTINDQPLLGALRNALGLGAVRAPETGIGASNVVDAGFGSVGSSPETSAVRVLREQARLAGAALTVAESEPISLPSTLNYRGISELPTIEGQIDPQSAMDFAAEAAADWLNRPLITEAKFGTTEPLSTSERLGFRNTLEEQFPEANSLYERNKLRSNSITALQSGFDTLDNSLSKFPVGENFAVEELRNLYDKSLFPSGRAYERLSLAEKMNVVRRLDDLSRRYLEIVAPEALPARIAPEQDVSNLLPTAAYASPGIGSLARFLGETRLGKSIQAATLGVGVLTAPVERVIGSAWLNYFAIGSTPANASESVLGVRPGATTQEQRPIVAIANNPLGHKAVSQYGIPSVQRFGYTINEKTGDIIRPGTWKSERGELYMKYQNRGVALASHVFKLRDYAKEGYLTPADIIKNKYVAADNDHPELNDPGTLKSDQEAYLTIIESYGLPRNKPITTIDEMFKMAEAQSCKEQSLCGAHPNQAVSQIVGRPTFSDADLAQARKIIERADVASALAESERGKIQRIGMELQEKGYSVTYIQTSQSPYRITKQWEKEPDTISSIGVHFTLEDGKKTAEKIIRDGLSQSNRPGVTGYVRGSFGYVGIADNCVEAKGCGIALLVPSKDLVMEPLRTNHISAQMQRRAGTESLGYNWNSIGLAANVNNADALKEGGRQAFMDMAIAFQKQYNVPFDRVFAHEDSNVRLVPVVQKNGEGVVLRELVHKNAYVPETLIAEGYQVNEQKTSTPGEQVVGAIKEALAKPIETAKKVAAVLQDVGREFPREGPTTGTTDQAIEDLRKRTIIAASRSVNGGEVVEAPQVGAPRTVLNNISLTNQKPSANEAEQLAGQIVALSKVTYPDIDNVALSAQLVFAGMEDTKLFQSLRNEVAQSFVQKKGTPINQSHIVKANHAIAKKTADLMKPDNYPHSTSDAHPITSYTTPGPITASRVVDDYLWEKYQSMYARIDGYDALGSDGSYRQDFTWKDIAGALNAGRSLREYVIGGLNSDIKMNLYFAGKAMDQEGIPWAPLAFYRGLERPPATGSVVANPVNSRHYCGGYGKGCAADLAGAGWRTVEEKVAANRRVWDWLEEHGDEYGLRTAFIANDPAHVQQNFDSTIAKTQKLALASEVAAVLAATRQAGAPFQIARLPVIKDASGAEPLPIVIASPARISAIRALDVAPPARVGGVSIISAVAERLVSEGGKAPGVSDALEVVRATPPLALIREVSGSISEPALSSAENTLVAVTDVPRTLVEPVDDDPIPVVVAQESSQPLERMTNFGSVPERRTFNVLSAIIEVPTAIGDSVSKGLATVQKRIVVAWNDARNVLAGVDTVVEATRPSEPRQAAAYLDGSSRVPTPSRTTAESPVALRPEDSGEIAIPLGRESLDLPPPLPSQEEWNRLVAQVQPSGSGGSLADDTVRLLDERIAQSEQSLQAAQKLANDARRIIPAYADELDVVTDWYAAEKRYLALAKAEPTSRESLLSAADKSRRAAQETNSAVWTQLQQNTIDASAHAELSVIEEQIRLLREMNNTLESSRSSVLSSLSDDTITTETLPKLIRDMQADAAAVQPRLPEISSDVWSSNASGWATADFPDRISSLMRLRDTATSMNASLYDEAIRELRNAQRIKQSDPFNTHLANASIQKAKDALRHIDVLNRPDLYQKAYSETVGMVGKPTQNSNQVILKTIASYISQGWKRAAAIFGIGVGGLWLASDSGEIPAQNTPETVMVPAETLSSVGSGGSTQSKGGTANNAQQPIAGVAPPGNTNTGFNDGTQTESGPVSGQGGNGSHNEGGSGGSGEAAGSGSTGGGTTAGAPAGGAGSANGGISQPPSNGGAQLTGFSGAGGVFGNSGFMQGGMSLLQGILGGLFAYFAQDANDNAQTESPSIPPQPQTPPQQIVGTIVANPSLIDSGESTTLSWSSVGTDVGSSTCAVITADFATIHRGGQNGSISSPALTESTRFGLVCNKNQAKGKLLHETLVRVRGDESDPPRIFTPEEIAASQSAHAGTSSGGAVSGGSGATGGGSSGQSGNPAPQDVRTCDPEQSMDSFIRCLCEAEPNPAGCTIPSGGLR